MYCQFVPLIDYDIRFKYVNTNFIYDIIGVAPSYLTKKDLLRNNSLSVQLEKNKKGTW